MAERERRYPIATSDARVSPGEPVRTCVGCGGRAPVTGLLRVVADGTSLVPDPRRRLPGRGASVHPSVECVSRAGKRRAFQRALKVSGQLDVSAVSEHVVGQVSDAALVTADRREDRPRTHEHAVKHQ